MDINDEKDYKEVVTTKNIYKTKTIIIATGADNRKLNIENEKELTGKGISYCATCDGAFYRKKDVAIVGGGNTAIEDAIYLSDIVNKVYLIHRRDSFRADKTLIEKLNEKKNIEYLYNSIITKIIGENKLESIEVTNNDSTKEVKIDGLFIAVGKVPETTNFTKLIEINENGYVVADETCHTNVEGIFVAGDNRVKKLRQLVTATSDGAVAATEAIKYLNK